MPLKEGTMIQNMSLLFSPIKPVSTFYECMVLCFISFASCTKLVDHISPLVTILILPRASWAFFLLPFLFFLFWFRTASWLLTYGLNISDVSKSVLCRIPATHSKQRQTFSWTKSHVSLWNYHLASKIISKYSVFNKGLLCCNSLHEIMSINLNWNVETCFDQDAGFWKRCTEQMAGHIFLASTLAPEPTRGLMWIFFK